MPQIYNVTQENLSFLRTSMHENMRTLFRNGLSLGESSSNDTRLNLVRSGDLRAMCTLRVRLIRVTPARKAVSSRLNCILLTCYCL